MTRALENKTSMKHVSVFNFFALINQLLHKNPFQRQQSKKTIVTVFTFKDCQFIDQRELKQGRMAELFLSLTARGGPFSPSGDV